MVAIWERRSPGAMDTNTPVAAGPDKATPVTFLNKDGRRLFGMLHKPETPRTDGVGILLLSPGVKGRVAPHRLYNKMTHQFVALGFPVLRFDFHGLGDAEGELQEALLADLYGAVQAGRYIGDTIAAMDWMEREQGVSRFIAAGLCGGALTGLLTAPHDSRVRAMLALSIPVIRDGSAIDSTLYMTDAQLEGNRQRYLGKLKLWDRDVWHSWVRLLTFQSHYSLIFRALTKAFISRRGKAPAPDQAAAEPADNTNPLFAPAFRHMVANRCPMLLIFAGTDRLLHEYDVKFAQRHRAWLDTSTDWYTMHVTKHANHVFSITEWQQEMLEQSRQWLEREFNAGAAAVSTRARSPRAGRCRRALTRDQRGFSISGTRMRLVDRARRFSRLFAQSISQGSNCIWVCSRRGMKTVGRRLFWPPSRAACPCIIFAAITSTIRGWYGVWPSSSARWASTSSTHTKSSLMSSRTGLHAFAVFPSSLPFTAGSGTSPRTV